MACDPSEQKMSAAARNNSSLESRTRTCGGDDMRSSRRIQQGTACGAEQGELVVGNHADGHNFHQPAHASFAEERVEKSGSLKFRQNLGGDAAREKNPAGSLEFQSEVAGLGAKDGHKDVEGLCAHGAFPAESGTRDCRGGVRFHHFPQQPFRGLAFAGVAQEIEDVDQARPRQNSLVADVVEARPEIFEKFDLKIIEWSKVAVAAFGGEYMMAHPVPIQATFAEASPGGYQREIAGCGRAALSRDIVQSDQIADGKRPDAPAGGFEIIDQVRARNFEFVGEQTRLDDPWQVRSNNSPIGDRAGNAETCLGGLNIRALDKFCNYFFQPGIVLARKNSNFC